MAQIAGIEYLLGIIFDFSDANTKCSIFFAAPSRKFRYQYKITDDFITKMASYGCQKILTMLYNEGRIFNCQILLDNACRYNFGELFAIMLANCYQKRKRFGTSASNYSAFYIALENNNAEIAAKIFEKMKSRGKIDYKRSILSTVIDKNCGKSVTYLIELMDAKYDFIYYTELSSMADYANKHNRKEIEAILRKRLQ